MADRLQRAISPYLRQHATNPVDWWEWGEPAFAEAASRGVPVLVSIGYSACHWCHVMAHESFEDPEVADYLNRHFVSIKVDREEYPAVDARYMAATQLLTGRGGWPMTVFTDATGRAFHAGTYYPPEPHHGLPSFTQVIHTIASVYAGEPDRIAELTRQVENAVAERADVVLPLPRDADLDSLEAATQTALLTLSRQYDRTNGGFSPAPKFPPAMTCEFLLRHHARTGSQPALDMVRGTCEAMARGGLFDQLGGGFARYSVDNTWTVPHFEKMLYDNALLLSAYTHLWRTDPQPLWRRVATMTADFLVNELVTASGGLASALDADSEPRRPGQNPEGAFYVWDRNELIEVLGEQDGHWAATLLAVQPANFEQDDSVLRLPEDPADSQRFETIRLQLLAARGQRPRPHRDDKVVSSWNGLAIAALSEAAMVLDRPDWLDAARAAADYVLTHHWRAPELARVSTDGIISPAQGTTCDYGNLAWGLFTLGMATGEHRWTESAEEILSAAIELFGFEHGFHDAQPTPLVPTPVMDPSDHANPSGLASMTKALALAGALGSTRMRELAGENTLRLADIVTTQPTFFGWSLANMESLLAGPKEVAVVAKRSEDATDLVRTFFASPSPGAVLAWGSSAPALLEGRTPVGGRASAYVCRDFVCDAPVTSTEDLRNALAR